MTSDPFLIVAIDGGAASGKSTTARALSERFHLLHSDTGSHYRTLTHHLLAQGVAAGETARVNAALPGLRLGTRLVGRSALLEVNGQVAGDEIRRQEVNEQVSHFAAVPAVRHSLLAYQRAQAEVARAHGFRGLVMEGRDIGSVIFPRADCRFFLQADPAERARRRAQQGQQDAIAERDRLDSQRRTAPLTCPEGAFALDTTHLGLAEVVELLSAEIARRLPPA